MKTASQNTPLRGRKRRRSSGRQLLPCCCAGALVCISGSVFYFNIRVSEKLLPTQSTGKGCSDGKGTPEFPSSPAQDLKTKTKKSDSLPDYQQSLTISNDWFDAQKWQDEGTPCFYVENVCQESMGFFYDAQSIVDSSKQPPLRINLKEAKIPGGYPFDVLIDSRRNAEMCPLSPIANHMVLYSLHNNMLADFYTRTISGLVAMHRTFSGRTDDERANSSWGEQTQLYLHMDSEKPRLRSDVLFLEAFSSNPVLSFQSLLDRTSCRCVRRLFFCGFQAASNGTLTTVKPATKVWRGWRSGEFNAKNDRNGHKSQAKFFEIGRKHLIHLLRRKNRRLEDMVTRFRSDAILQHVERKGKEIDISEWKLVGLSQRNSRRSWMHLSKDLKACNHKFNPMKVACVEVNVESESATPINHFVMHRAVDMLIGVHGSSLTNGIWMNEGSTVLELLPYVPDGMIGKWARFVSGATAVGVVFTGTTINHIGYRLGPRSIPQCKECWGNETKMFDFLKKTKNRWDDRNFEVHGDILEAAISRFLLSDNLLDCSHLQRMSNETGHVFVLYNVLCGDKKGVKPFIHHFYHTDEGNGMPFGKELEFRA